MKPSSIPPFYVGQMVEAIKSHSGGDFKRGESFTVTGVKRTPCCRKWVITIGLPNAPYNGAECSCGGTYRNEGEANYSASSFRAITESFQPVSYSKILEEVPCGAN